MDRRTFTRGVALGVLAIPLALRAQPTGKNWRIAYLRDGVGPIPQAVVDALHDLGWVQGRNVTFELREARSADQLPALAAELVGLKVDVIMTSGTNAARAAKEATTVIPVVFSIAADPVERGLVASLGQPGGNLTGFTLGLSSADKLIEIFKAALPALSRVAYPMLEGQPQPSLTSVATLGVQVQRLAVQNPEDFRPFFAAAKKAGNDGAMIPNIAPIGDSQLERIGAQALESRFPAIGFRRNFAQAGGLMSFGPLILEGRMRVAAQVDRILRGAKPAEVPVEQSSKFELVVNLKTARILGVSIAQPALLRATEVIQ